MRPAAYLVICIAFFLSGACGVADKSTQDSQLENQFNCGTQFIKETSTIRHCGLIDYKLLQYLKNEKDTRTLLLTSEGGQILDAISLSKYLDEYKIRLIIEGYCLSACATFLVAGTDLVTIQSNSILGFHHSTTSLAMRGTQNGLLNEGQLKRIHEEFVQPEISFFEENNISTAWLFEPDLRTKPSCVKRNLRFSDEVPIIDYRARHRFWVPSIPTLKKLNPTLILEGNAQTHDAVQTIANTHLLLKGQALLYGNPENLEFNPDDINLLSQLPFCS
ncbi:hypothetical protein [Hirschia litorea]|uniref:Uncharacterized protein n=1 Tax=Hirschia litorea TaxID=1199156 RepID=A0ABW2IP71_9PROT